MTKMFAACREHASLALDHMAAQAGKADVRVIRLSDPHPSFHCQCKEPAMYVLKEIGAEESSGGRRSHSQALRRERLAALEGPYDDPRADVRAERTRADEDYPSEMRDPAAAEEMAYNSAQFR